MSYRCEDMSLSDEELIHYDASELIKLDDGKTYHIDYIIACDNCKTIWPSHDHPIDEYGLCDMCDEDRKEEIEHYRLERMG
jgi:hypothetical protein